MTILAFTNFGARELDFCSDAITNVTYNTTIKKSGRQSLHIGADGLGTASNFRLNNSYLGRFYWFYLYIVTLPATYCEITYEYNISGSHALRLYSDGKLALWTNGQTPTMSSSALSTGVWYKIAMVHSALTGVHDVTVYVDNVQFATRSLPRGINYIRLGKQTALSGEFLLCSYVAADSDEIQNYDFAVDDLYPNGNGTYTAYTGSYTDVDEFPNDGITSYVQSTLTSGDAETFALGGDASFDTIIGHLLESRVASSSNLSGASYKMRLRYGGTNYDDSVATAISGTTFVLKTKLTAGLSVKKNQLLPIEIGFVEQSTTRTHRISNCLISVLSLNVPDVQKIGPRLQVI